MVANATIHRNLCLFWLCSNEKLQRKEKRELNLKEKEVNTMTPPLKMTLLSSMLMALLLPAVAQTSAPTQNGAVPAQTTTPTQATTPAKSSPPTIQQRKENQQDRIANGVSDGQLTAGESSNLEKKESELNQEERDMKAQDNGHLTNADRSVLNQQQNQLSNQIYKDKHNSAVQKENPQGTAPTTKIGKRVENQQDRIGQGIQSGQLTAGESANLEKQESAVNKEMAAEKQLNGGKLTNQEKAQVNRQQNQLSKEIYKDKHNAKRQAH